MNRNRMIHRSRARRSSAKERARLDAPTLWLLAALCGAGCGRPHSLPSTAASQKPAVVEPGRVTLAPQAEARLGIPEGLAAVEHRALPERRLFAGEVLPAPGHAVLVTAPLAGMIVAAQTEPMPQAGAHVRAGQPLLALAPVLALGERAQAATLLADAESQLARARAQEQATALALERAERLVRDGLAGTKLVEEARAQHATASAAQKAAESQQAALSGRGTRPGLLGATTIVSPIDGTVRDVRVAPRQQVTAGAALLELVSRDALWLRVPVSSSEIARLDAGAEARVGALGEEPSAALAARPVHPAPETAQPVTGTVDLYFVLPADARFRIGQRLAAWLGARGSRDGLVVPAAALLYGTAGEAWVYERTAPQIFHRRRVEVLRIEGAMALLRPGSGELAPPARVVTAGAHELFGAELGVGK